MQEMFDEMEYQSIELLPGDIADGEVGNHDNSLSLILSQTSDLAAALTLKQVCPDGLPLAMTYQT